MSHCGHGNFNFYVLALHIRNGGMPQIMEHEVKNVSMFAGRLKRLSD